MPNLFRSAIALLLSVCAAVASAQTGDKAAAPDYKLGPGDAIKVQVYQNPDLTVEARVSENGSISYPLVGSVPVGGMSISEAERRIERALKEKDILKQPQVNIVLLQVRGNQVSVLGQVQRPGRFPLETINVRVSDMLAAAGGVTPTGRRRAGRQRTRATASHSASPSTFRTCSRAPARTTTSCWRPATPSTWTRHPPSISMAKRSAPAPTASSAA